jgi:PatG C-terminal
MDGRAHAIEHDTPPETAVEPAQTGPVPSPTLASAEHAYIYAHGQVEAQFPNLSVEKELAQVAGLSDYGGMTDRQVLKEVISARENRYLARSLCWIFAIEGLETYILYPRDPADWELLIDAFRAEPRRDDLDVVIGVRGGLAPPSMCNGLTLPVVGFDQLYSFDRDALIEAIPQPESMPDEQLGDFRVTAGRFFDQLLQLADNVGATDEHRAINYVMVRYPRIYSVTTEMHDRNFAFSGVEVLPSNLAGVRSVQDVVLSYTHRQTDVVEKHFVRVDVTGEFPFLVTKMQPFYQH